MTKAATKADSDRPGIVTKAEDTAAAKKKAAAAKAKRKFVTVVMRKTLFLGRDDAGNAIWGRVNDVVKMEQKKAAYHVGIGDCMTVEQQASGMESEYAPSTKKGEGKVIDADLKEGVQQVLDQ
jgi:hypothetical protein